MRFLSGTNINSPRAFKWQRLLWIIPALFLYVPANLAVAEDYSSSSFTVRDPVISNSEDTTGGTSTSFQVRGAAGETATGANSSTDFTLQGGSQSGDETAPVAGTVNDGSGADIDHQSDMTTLSANWSGFSDPESGLRQYDYSLQRVVDNQCWNDNTTSWGSCTVWNDVTLSTSFNLSNPALDLRTGSVYVTCVRATNNASLATTVCSNGVQIDPSLTFSYDSTSVAIPVLNSADNWDGIGTSTLTVDTNAYSGYSIYASKTDLMRSVTDPTQTIPDVPDGGCSGSAVTWPGATYFGFSSSSDVDSNKFHSGGTKFCAFPTTSNPTQGVMVVDNTQPITGGSLIDGNTITYQTQTNFSQVSGQYQVNILYTVLPRF